MIVQLPRRRGFWVRVHARMRVLPGDVSTAALLQLRAIRNQYLVATAIFAIGLPVLLAVVPMLSAGVSEEPAVVAAVAVPGELRPNDEVEVILEGGAVLRFTEDPGVDVGDVVLVRTTRPGYRQELVVPGGPTAPAIEGSGMWPAVAWIGGVLVVFLVVTSPRAVLAHRASRQVCSDLGQATVTMDGIYLGSWTWRGIVAPAKGEQARFVTCGFPIAVEDDGRDVRWFGAPVRAVSALRMFEEELADTSRRVTVTYHPNSSALARIESAETGRSLELAHGLDELDPSTGLTLKVGRTRAEGDLPDR